MNIEILVDSTEFWPALERDIAAAERSVYLQAMTFEADGAGTPVERALSRSPAVDKRVLIDEFTKHMVNDCFVHAPRHWWNRELRLEVRETRRMVRDLERDGVPVAFTNPAGPLLARFPLRNHKKLMVIDGRVAYLGGINFSDHNFAWHDMMCRIDDPDVAGFLHDDFLATWGGRDRRARLRLDGVELHVTDGRRNPGSFAPIFELVESARERVFVECPYITFPFLDALAAARRRGVEVTVVTSEINNWKQLRDYIPWGARRAGIELRALPGRFTHLKALLVDDRALVVGSPNYDVFTYYLHQEMFAVITDRGAIDRFRERVEEPDVSASRPVAAPRGAARARLRHAQLRVLGQAVRGLHLLP